MTNATGTGQGPGDGNTAVGDRALKLTTGGSNNTAFGARALNSNTTGVDNTANGFDALRFNTTGIQNTATGINALISNGPGNDNTGNGVNTLYWNTTGAENTAIGNWALFNNRGSDNVALGFNAGSGLWDGSNNIYTGAGMSGSFEESNTCYIGSIFGRTSAGGVPVFINGSGKLGTTTSSRRFKEDIKPMNNASEALFALEPVTFRYKKDIDPHGIPQFGLIAEEVEKVDPDLIVRDKEGRINTVRYDQVNAMLLNEFLKEHKKVEAQQATIRQLKSNNAKQEATIGQITKDIRGLTAQFKEQSAQLQKVSAQVRWAGLRCRVVTNR